MYNHQLDAFLKAAELGSFGKGAEALYISTPAMIQQINALEAKCGARLFVRTHRGVTLTPAGRAFYEDARTLVKLSADALARVRRIEAEARSTVRIGTSLLFKCRRFPDLWSRVSPRCPGLRVEILPLPEHQGLEGLFAGLGADYDLVEGVYGSLAYPGLCDFLELDRTPLCCGVRRDHPLAGAARLTLGDLQGECLVMPVPGLSAELDDFRRRAAEAGLSIREVPYYGVDTFALCEVTPCVLITQQVYADIHPNLVTVPLEGAGTLPYGLLYAKTPTPAARQFLAAARQ